MEADNQQYGFVGNPPGTLQDRRKNATVEVNVTHNWKVVSVEEVRVPRGGDHLQLSKDSTEVLARFIHSGKIVSFWILQDCTEWF